MNENLFITIPDTTLPNGTVVPSFQAGQYLSSKGSDGKVAICAEGAPWVRINYEEAKAAAAEAGLALITELQWLAIASNASQQDCNWTKGKVGAGKLFRGLRKGNVSSAQPGNVEPADTKERRWLTLSNGERICDMNGNAYSWVFDDVQGDADGLTGNIASNSPSIVTAPFKSMEKGTGWRPGGAVNWSGYALVRGGCWGSRDSAGVFYLGVGSPSFEGDYVGFRCTQ